MINFVITLSKCCRSTSRRRVDLQHECHSMVYIQCTLKHFPLLILLKLMTCFNLFFFSHQAAVILVRTMEHAYRNTRRIAICVFARRDKEENIAKNVGARSQFITYIQIAYNYDMCKSRWFRAWCRCRKLLRLKDFISKNRFWLNRHSRCSIVFLPRAQTIRKKKKQQHTH